MAPPQRRTHISNVGPISTACLAPSLSGSGQLSGRAQARCTLADSTALQPRTGYIANARTRGEDVSEAAGQGRPGGVKESRAEKMRWASNRQPSARADGGWCWIWPLLECERFPGEVLRIPDAKLA